MPPTPVIPWADIVGKNVDRVAEAFDPRKRELEDAQLNLLKARAYHELHPTRALGFDYTNPLTMQHLANARLQNDILKHRASGEAAPDAIDTALNAAAAEQNNAADLPAPDPTTGLPASESTPPPDITAPGADVTAPTKETGGGEDMQDLKVPTATPMAKPGASLANVQKAAPKISLVSTDEDGTQHFSNGMTRDAAGVVTHTVNGQTIVKYPGAHTWTTIGPKPSAAIHEIDPSDPSKRPYVMKNGELVPVPIQGSENPLDGVQMGEGVLAGMSKEQAELIKKFANYELPLTSLGRGGISNPKIRAILEKVTAYDPTFDATQYQARQKVRNSFTSGPDSKNITSLNTAIGHLNELATAADGLDNGKFKAYNSLKNWFREETGDPSITRFQTAAGAVESELATVFKGTSATDQEIKAWREKLSSSKSPEQLKAAIDEAISLMAGRMGALQSKYSEGTGKPNDFNILNPKSKAILERLGRKDVVEADNFQATPPDHQTTDENGPNSAPPKDRPSDNHEVDHYYQDHTTGKWWIYKGDGRYEPA